MLCHPPMITRLALALFLAGAFPLCTFAGEAPATDLDRALDELSTRYDIVGLSVVGVRDGKVAYAAQRGLADRDRGVPVSAATKFRIASISKTITATALMQFWEQGRFRLDDDVSLHLGYKLAHPQFPDTPITFRQLLTHTAGFKDGPAYDAFLMHTYHHSTNAPGLRELLCPGGEFYRDGAVFGTNAPGAKYAYSNLGFGLLGTLVERFADERFDRYCTRVVLAKLDMTASFNPADLGTNAPLAVLYEPDGTGWQSKCDDYRGAAPPDRLGKAYPVGRNALPCAPQGGLRASALELAKFMHAFNDPAHGAARGILKPATVEVMLGRTSAEGAAPGALGFHRTERLLPGEVWLGHTGSAYGLKSLMYWEADGALGVIVLTNGSRPGAEAGGTSAVDREISAAVVRHLRAKQ
jgi:CubicO group peptidase (beta-lactamase class C family)